MPKVTHWKLFRYERNPPLFCFPKWNLMNVAPVKIRWEFLLVRIYVMRSEKSYTVGKIDFEILIVSHSGGKDKHFKRNHLKRSILQWVVAFWSLKAETVHFEKTEVKVFGAAFEKKCTPSCTYSYRRINDGSKLVFDADQHPEVHLAGNDYSFTLICKENTIFHIHLWIYLMGTQSKINELVQNMDRNVVWNNFYTFPFKTENLHFFPQQL